jgi:hypothetical protein
MIRIFTPALVAALLSMAGGPAMAQSGSEALLGSRADSAQPTSYPGAERRYVHGPRPDRSRRGWRRAHALFRGVDLTPAQRRDVQRVHERYISQYRDLRKSLEPDLRALREARSRADTEAARRAEARLRVGRQKFRQLSERERTDVRSMLSPSQRDRFDRNVSRLQEGQHRRRGPERHRRHDEAPEEH